MSTHHERDDTTSVTVYQVFQDLDNYRGEHDPGYHYDAEAGLAQLHNTIDRLGGAHTDQAHRTSQANDEVSEPASNMRAHLQGATGAARREIVSERIDGLIITELKMSSRISPEVAVRRADGIHGQRWASSWLPGRVLTREQAFSAMVLDEILTDPDELDSATMMLILAELAATLGMPLQQALVRLSYIKKPDNYPRSPWTRCARTLADPNRSQQSEVMRLAK